MADVRIEVVTYEQSRLAYFKELQSRQKKRFEQFEKSSALKDLPPQERHSQLSQMGEVLQYYDDIVKMLETDVVPRAELDILKSTITQNEEEAYNRGYAEATKEIFEEIEEMLIFSSTLPRCAMLIDIDMLAELKKKYTEQCPDCKHFIGCEKAVWHGLCEEYDKNTTEVNNGRT